MQKSEIMEILDDWNFWKKEQETGITREEYKKKIQELEKAGIIVCATGVRRSGKSTLLLQFCKSLIESGKRKEDILIVNFEDPRFKNLSLELLNRIYDIYLTELGPGKKHYVILDEIHTISGWEKFARYLYENKKASVFVSGSSSKLLSKEYATTLAGRHLDLEVYPLSFKEFIIFKGVSIKDKLDVVSKRHVLQKLFSEYLEFGGFPKVVLTEREEEKRELLNAYFRDIIIKDISLRYKIRETAKLEEMAKYYLSNISSLHSFNKIKNILNVGIETAERFSEYFSNAYLLFFVKKFSYSLKEQILNPKKVYCIDNGLRNVISFRFRENIGQLYENLVFLELSRRKKEIFYWKNRGGEVDFLIKKGRKTKEAIQVCYNIEDEKTRKREINSLIECMKQFKLKEGMIVTEEKETEEKIEGRLVRFIPLWKWLLS